MDASILITDKFWESIDPVAMGDFEGIMPPHEGLLGHVLFQTSGSMGWPKWVALSKEALTLSADVVNRHLGVTAESCWGLALPWHHVGGFGVLTRAYMAECRLEHFAETWDPEALVRWLEARKVTHTSLVPTQVHDLVAGKFVAPSCLKAVVVGGGPLPTSLGREARELGWPVLASYGMTEASSQVATQGLEALRKPYVASPIELLPHWQVKVTDEGRLFIAGESLFSGVITHEDGDWDYRERDGDWYVTQDLMDLADGALTPLGRADLRIKVLGELVNLVELEAKLVELSERAIPLEGLVVVPVPDARAGHALVPVVDAVLDRELVEKALAQYAEGAPGYCRLRAPVFLDPFPRSPLGKTRRRECLRQVIGGGNA